MSNKLTKNYFLLIYRAIILPQKKIFVNS